MWTPNLITAHPFLKKKRKTHKELKVLLAYVLSCISLFISISLIHIFCSTSEIFTHLSSSSKWCKAPLQWLNLDPSPETATVSAEFLLGLFRTFLPKNERIDIQNGSHNLKGDIYIFKPSFLDIFGIYMLDFGGGTLLKNCPISSSQPAPLKR